MYMYVRTTVQFIQFISGVTTRVRRAALAFALTLKDPLSKELRLARLLCSHAPCLPRLELRDFVLDRVHQGEVVLHRERYGLDLGVWS